MKFTRNFDLEIFFSKYEFNVAYNIGGSDLESVTVGDLIGLCSDAEKTAWERLYLGYTETYGSPGLRQAISDTYVSLSPEHILCCAGAEEAIFALMNALLGPDDHVMVTYPNYQSAETIPLGLCRVTGIPLDPDNNWAMDLDFVKDAIRPETKLIYINFPNNPTGKVLEKEVYRELVSLCDHHGIYLFSDEVYRMMERSGEIRLDQAADVYERGISLNVMSKAYGMAGLRIGWLASRDTDLLGKAERIKHFLSICNSGPSEFLATVALKNREVILQRNRDLVSANLQRLTRFFNSCSDLFQWVEPDGGCIGYPRYLGKDGVEAFVQRVIDDLGVLFLPASVFQSDLGQAPTDRFRVGFGRRYFSEAIGNVEHYLRSRH